MIQFDGQAKNVVFVSLAVDSLSPSMAERQVGFSGDLEETARDEQRLSVHFARTFRNRAHEILWLDRARLPARCASGAQGRSGSAYFSGLTQHLSRAVRITLEIGVNLALEQIVQLA